MFHVVFQPNDRLYWGAWAGLTLDGEAFEDDLNTHRIKPSRRLALHAD